MSTNAAAVPGAKFGKLEVVETRWRQVDQPCGRRARREAVCNCECGNTGFATLVCRLGKSSRSCGCIRKSVGGVSKSRHYKIAAGARSRCENPRNQSYKDYGGRGITFNFESPAEAASYISMLPFADDRSRTLDRIQVNGPYAIGNLRWATVEEQRANQRRNLPDEEPF